MANEGLNIEKRDDGVAIVRMDIPGEPMNTLKADFVDTFMDVFGRIERDSDIKAVVLGKSVCRFVLSSGVGGSV